MVINMLFAFSYLQVELHFVIMTFRFHIMYFQKAILAIAYSLISVSPKSIHIYVQSKLIVRDTYVQYLLLYSTNSLLL